MDITRDLICTIVYSATFLIATMLGDQADRPQIRSSIPQHQQRRRSSRQLSKQQQQRRYVPYPPQERTIDNINGIPCADFTTPTLCRVATHGESARLPCFGCREYRYECQHLNEDTIILSNEREYTLPQNTSMSEGYCLPSRGTLETPNIFTTQTLLAQRNNQLLWINRCRYPQLFTHSDYLADCDQFVDTCAGLGTFTDSNGNYFDASSGESVWFDPLVDGRCRPYDEEQWVGVWDEIFGPNIQAATITNAADYAGMGTILNDNHYIDTGVVTPGEMQELGIKASVSRTLGSYPATMIPKPCQVDPLSGATSNRNRYDNTSKNCICDTINGWLPIFIDEDLSGNYVDVEPGAYSANACLKVATRPYLGHPEVYMGNYVNPDRTAETLMVWRREHVDGFYTNLIENYIPSNDNNNNESSSDDYQNVIFRDDSPPRFTILSKLVRNNQTPLFYTYGHYYKWPMWHQWRENNFSEVKTMSFINDLEPIQWWEINSARFRTMQQFTWPILQEDITSSTSLTHGSYMCNHMGARHEIYYVFKLFPAGVAWRLERDFYPYYSDFLFTF